MELTVGQIVEGKITGITNFGVFVDLGEGKSGLVHISEVARSYVSDIKEFVKVGDAVKMKVLSIGEDGKISLSIKRALEPEAPAERRERREKRPSQPAKIDSSYTWTPKKNEPASFEEMMNRFKQTSDEKFSDLKRKNPEAKRSKRGSVK
ncbi:MAG: S1 RNA-binding domain-containing protein [Clostridia bacterium]|nr:S1 RNA-binding domain-containing protein [Clostridia bacterium]